MSISIIGTGKMGQAVATALLESNTEINQFNSTNPVTAQILQETNSKIVVDCSIGSAFLENLPLYLENRQKVVVVASNWYDNFDKVKAQVESQNGDLIFAKNFSITLQIYQKLLKEACKSFANYPEFDVFGLEWHHRAKKDSPSSTTQALAKTIIENSPSKSNITYENPHTQIAKDTLHFACLRGGEDNIVHNIYFDNENETIELKHSIKNRKAIVLGILNAIKYIENHQGFYAWEDTI